MILLIETKPASRARIWSESARQLELNEKVVCLAMHSSGPVAEAVGDAMEVFKLPKLSRKIKHLVPLISSLAGFSKKICRFYGMYPFETVLTSGWLGAGASIILKLRFNSQCVWHFDEDEWTHYDSFWTRRLTFLFCDRLIISAKSIGIEEKGEVRPSIDRVVAWKSSAILIRDFSSEARLEALRRVFPESGKSVAVEKKAA